MGHFTAHSLCLTECDFTFPFDLFESPLNDIALAPRCDRFPLTSECVLLWHLAFVCILLWYRWPAESANIIDFVSHENNLTSLALPFAMAVFLSPLTCKTGPCTLCFFVAVTVLKVCWLCSLCWSCKSNVLVNAEVCVLSRLMLWKC